MSYDKQQKAVCPHCGNTTIFDILHMEQTLEEITFENGEAETYDAYNFLAKCKTCNDVVLFYTWENDDNPGKIYGAHVLYPARKKTSSIVPKNIRDVYEEAIKIKKISPTMFVVAVRKALEMLCNEQNAKGKNLNEKIKDLSDKNIIPGHLARIANALRIFGNLGAHETIQNVKEDEATLIDDIYNALIEYVYIAPDKLNRLAEKYKKHS